MSTFGKQIIINLFGESHGNGVGIVINNFPAGIKIDLDEIRRDLSLRRPSSKISTERVEMDEFKFLSGYYKGFTTGSPLSIFIENTNKRSKDYNREILRPSHADYTAHVKYNGYEDYRGGGHFSGRVTAPLMILGTLCKQVLRSNGIYIGSHISSIKDINDIMFKDVDITNELLQTLVTSDFPLLDFSKKDSMINQIVNAKRDQDSVGGTIETSILGIKPGYGDPFFDSIESTLSHLLFSIPAIKGVSFGAGFGISKMFGSEANDSILYDNGTIKTLTNNSGGIQGGISNGMPILVNCVVKPTASIGKLQKSIDINTLESADLELKGRHDPCIVQRAIHVVNAITNYAVLEIITRNEGYSWIK
jgi:chorismate synthase